jgi:Zn finger protein HypA/HybF involved in hydrogenase expression
MLWFVDNLLATPVRPVCPKCGAPMWLIRIEPEKPDFAQRTFECPRCQNQMTEIIDLEKAA